jgi:endonuclease/exonuclease/phosphatase family metal-dependent hydrolase
MAQHTALRFCSLLLLFTAGCVHAHNHVDPSGPRFVGAARAATAPGIANGQTLHVASFNVQLNVALSRALDVFNEHAELHRADVVLLQEMDAHGTELIATVLGMHWAYYPAREANGRGLGNAVLSRWPIIDDAKLILPHTSLIGATQRIATAVTIRVGDTPVRIYSLHLATPVQQRPAQRLDQVMTVLRDAAKYSHVIVGGDFNSATLPRRVAEAGYAWPTRDGPRTTRFSRVDHILYKGFATSNSGAAGTVADNRGASDHLPVWAKARMVQDVESEDR